MMARATLLTFLLLLISVAGLIADETNKDLAKEVAAAEGGDFDAMLRVAVAFLNDTDEANNADGVKWLEMSTAGGNLDAYYNLGAHYQDGGPVKQDKQKALMYLTVAAELGEIRAMNRLAGIYYTGELVPANDLLAVKWALIASGLGSETAKTNLERMRTTISKRDAVLGGHAAAAWIKNRGMKLKK